MSAIKRSGIVYAQTSVQIPEQLRDDARTLGINISGTLTEALQEKIDNIRGRDG